VLEAGYAYDRALTTWSTLLAELAERDRVPSGAVLLEQRPS
jgi:hypothetical protein